MLKGFSTKIFFQLQIKKKSSWGKYYHVVIGVLKEKEVKILQYPPTNTFELDFYLAGNTSGEIHVINKEKYHIHG